MPSLCATFPQVRPRWAFPRGSWPARTRVRREDHAAKLGFSAYAIAADMNDPMVQAIHRLIDHAAETDARLQDLIAHLKEGGIDLGDAKATAAGFDPKRLSQMID